LRASPLQDEAGARLVLVEFKNYDSQEMPTFRFSGAIR